MSALTTFATRLKWARHHRGLSMTALADLSSISQPMIHRYENAKNGASVRFLRSNAPQKLADALQVNSIWLMTGEGQPFATQPTVAEYDSMVQQVSASKKEIESMRLWTRYNQADAATQALINILLAPASHTESWVSESLRISIESTKAITAACIKSGG